MIETTLSLHETKRKRQIDRQTDREREREREREKGKEENQEDIGGDRSASFERLVYSERQLLSMIELL